MRVNRFRKIANSTQPPLASVESVLVEGYQGEIMPAWQFASIGTFSQMNKAIPLLLEMRDDIKEMKGDIKEVRKNTDTIPQVLEEMRICNQFSADADGYQSYKGTAGDALNGKAVP